MHIGTISVLFWSHSIKFYCSYHCALEGSTTDVLSSIDTGPDLWAQIWLSVFNCKATLGYSPAVSAAFITAQFSELTFRSLISPGPLARTKPRNIWKNNGKCWKMLKTKFLMTEWIWTQFSIKFCERVRATLSLHIDEWIKNET